MQFVINAQRKLITKTRFTEMLSNFHERTHLTIAQENCNFSYQGSLKAQSYNPHIEIYIQFNI